MKPRHTRRPDRSARSTRLRLACALLAAGLALPPPLYAQTAPPRKTTPAVGSSTLVTLNFVNQDIEAVTRAVAAMIERQIVVDPRVRGTITLYSEQPLSVRDAYLNYQVALRGLGFSVVESGGLLKLVPEAEAKLQTGVVSVGEAPTRGDQVITQVFTLRYENPNNLVAVLRPLISANNTINANPGNNALVITDYADNLQRLGKIVAALDIPSATDIEIIPLQHAVASDIATLVQRLSDGAGAVPGAAVGGAVTVLAEARSNSLIVRAPNAARLAGIRSQIEKLDRPTPGGGPGGNIWVVHLKNADSTKLATVLRAAFSGGGGSGGGSSASSTGFSGTNTTPGAPGQPGATPGTAPLAPSAQPSTGGFVQADPATNSLIVSGPEPLYRQVRAMIDQLDSRRAQVYIESMIVEISGDNAADFGFQWQGLLGNKGDNYGLAAGTNFTPSGGTGNILNISALAAGASAATGIPVGEGLNLGLIRNYGGTYALAAIARLLQSQTNTNIVSTPNLITLDNEEAKIVVGSNVPFITGQSITTGGSTSNPFQTIERKDVGITLRIKPQVGESGTVRMAIFQESSSVDGTVAPGTTNAGPSTKKRSIESNVVVDDGQIIVLGGLIEDSFTENKSQIPLLGDLPLVGALFRSQSRQKKRTNLMVFIRPVVMRDTASADRLSLDRYDLIRARQEAAQPVPSMLLPIEGAPMLPPLSQSIVQPVPTGPKAPSVLAPTQTPTPTPEPALR